MGSSIESETWQPRKVISNKLNTNITYPAATNYWTPLYENDNKEEPKEEEILMIQQSIKAEQQPKSNKWTRRIEQQQTKQRQQKELNIIIDSGATSYFISKDITYLKQAPSKSQSTCQTTQHCSNQQDTTTL
jgi:hypothetical protein